MTASLFLAGICRLSSNSSSRHEIEAQERGSGMSDEEREPFLSVDFTPKATLSNEQNTITL